MLPDNPMSLNDDSSKNEKTPPLSASQEKNRKISKNRAKNKERHVSLGHQIWYQICRSTVYLVTKLYFRTKYIGCRNIPWTGPVLIVSNHQSFLDPMSIGAGSLRRFNYLARKTLFRFKPFGWLIDSVDAIPLNQEGLGLEGIKETLRRLKNKEAVLLFPEGARSEDGEIAPFKDGFISIALRSQAAILPTATAGAFEAWPRKQKFPSCFKRRVRIEYGEPIPYEIAKSMPQEELRQLIEKRVHEIYQRIR